MKWLGIFIFTFNLVKKNLARAIVCVMVGMASWCPLDLAFAGSPHSSDHKPIEFSARLVWQTGGRMAKAQLFVKKDRYRIEPARGIRTELGYAGVTIVRLDEQKIWHVLSQRRMILSVPFTSDYLLPFSIILEGETSRTVIGDSMVEDQPALLYEVEVTHRVGERERYYQWVDPQRKILLKLLSQDRNWVVEYHRVVLSPQPDYYFEAPLGYRTIEYQDIQVPRG